jgi:hypothetical protein
MQNKILFSFIVSFALLMIVTNPLYASAASGTVKYNGVGISGAKVTFEQSGSVPLYASTVTSSGGTWSYALGSGTWQIDAMKSGFTHPQQSGVGSTQTGLIHNLSARSNTVAEFKIAGDDEFRNSFGTAWKTTAKSKLVTAEAYFKDEHSISFADVAYFDTWTSTTTNCSIMLDEGKTQTGWSSGTYSGAQVLALFTGTTLSGSTNGCVRLPLPTIGGTHPAFVVNAISVSDSPRRIMHEITHLYGFTHTLTCSTIVPSIMKTDSSEVSCPNQLMNWTPTDDQTLENRRSWY